MDKFDFYKKRDFGTYISDTFQFFKIYFRDFLKNFLIVNGAIILAFVIISGLLMTSKYMGLILVFTTGNLTMLSDLIITLLVILVLLFIVMLFVSCFPIAYALITEKNPERKNFSASELLQVIHPMIGRMFLFGLISIFVVSIPYIIVSLLVAYILGSIPFLGEILYLIFFIAFGTAVNVWISQSMFQYVKDKEDYFVALGKGFEITKVQFLHKAGATLAMVFIMYGLFFVVALLLIVVSMVLQLIGIYDVSVLSVIAAIVLGFAYFLGLVVLFNLPVFLQIMIHYSSKNDKKTYSEIDQIGTNLDA